MSYDEGDSVATTGVPANRHASEPVGEHAVLFALAEDLVTTREIAEKLGICEQAVGALVMATLRRRIRDEA